jgi:glyoxylase I family protein
VETFAGIDHTALASRDPLRLANWYIEHLGFRMAAENEGKYFVAAPDGSLLEMIPGEGNSVLPQMKDPGVRHIALRVRDFEAAWKSLRDRQLEFISEPIYVNALRLRVIFFRDLDGNILHLIHRQE